MKKIGKLLGAIICLSVFLVGCSSTAANKDTEEIKYADQNFISDMAKGLEARWGLNEKDENKKGFEDIAVNSKEYQTMMISYIDAELNCIEKYTDEKFEDNNLKEIAVTYVNLLQKHKKACEYMTVDYEKYLEEFQPVYDERSKVISKMLSDYGMEIDDKYAETVKEFQTRSTLVKEEEDTKEAVSKMLGAVEFHVIEEKSGGYKTYQGIIENTSEKDFNNFSVNINLIDSEGVIVETQYDNVSNLKKGSKAQFEFMTDKEFVSTEMTANWWD